MSVETTLLLCIIAALALFLVFCSTGKLQARETLRALWPELTDRQRGIVKCYMDGDIEWLDEENSDA